MLQANFGDIFSGLLKIFLTGCCLTGTSFSHPIISEFSASNSIILQDEDDDFEWIELQDISNKQVNLFESSFAEGIGFDFRSADSVTLRPKEVILIVSNKESL
jgi:hypothetical protein